MKIRGGRIKNLYALFILDFNHSATIRIPLLWSTLIHRICCCICWTARRLCTQHHLANWLAFACNLSSACSFITLITSYLTTSLYFLSQKALQWVLWAYMESQRKVFVSIALYEVCVQWSRRVLLMKEWQITSVYTSHKYRNSVSWTVKR